MILYRFERNILSDYYNTIINLVSYPVISETKAGYWIMDFTHKKWVSKTAKKRFAYPTVDEAKENFIKRTEVCIKIQRSQLKMSEAFLDVIKNNPESILKKDGNGRLIPFKNEKQINT